MRPLSIIWFQWLYLGSLAAGLVSEVLTWKDNPAIASPAFILTVQAFSVAIMLLLYFLIAHRRSGAAKWVLTLLYAAGILVALSGLMNQLRTDIGAEFLFGLAITLVQGVTIGLLFTPSARAWLAARRVDEAEPLRRTFE